MPKVTQGLVDSAHAIRTQFETDVERARNDGTLSTTGRAQKIAVAWQTAKAGMDGLRINFEGFSALTAQDIKKQVFGAQSVTGADAVSMRDAYDRANQVQSAAEAATLLHQADVTGDDHLARALASRAFDGASSGSVFAGADDWGQVLNSYTTTRPEVAAKLQELTDAQQSGVKASLDLSGYTYLVKPDELARASDYQVELLANGQDAWNPTNPHPHTTPAAPARVGREWV